MEKNEKDPTFIAVTIQSSSQDEDEGTIVCSDRSSSNSKNDEQSKIMALEVEIQRLKDELISVRKEIKRLKSSAQASSGK